MKQLLLTALAASALFTGCKKESPSTSPPPTASFLYSGAGTAPATVSFTNTSENATSFTWDFGDNSTSTANSPTHTFAQGGVYTVRLTATGSGGSSSVSKTVNIAAPTSVKITGVKVTALPFLDPSCGCGWDANSGPDVYFQLTDNAATPTVLLSGNVQNDVTQTMLPLSWVATPAYQITNFTTTYKLVVYDKDTNDVPPNPDDFIGGYSFNFAGFAAQGYPTTGTLFVSGGSVKIDLTLQWQ